MPTIMGFNISTSLKTQKQLFLKKRYKTILKNGAISNIAKLTY